MKKEEFLKKLSSALQAEMKSAAKVYYLPKGFTSKDREMQKEIIDCNQKYASSCEPALQHDMIYIETRDGSIQRVVRILADDLYQKYQKDGFDTVLHNLLDTLLQDEVFNAPTANLEKRLQGYQTVKDTLIIRPLNIRNIREEDIYRKKGDIALVLYQLVGDKNKTLFSSRIRREEAEQWNEDINTVFDAALINTSLLFPAVVYDFKKEEEINFLREEVSMENISYHGFVLLSVHNGINGALSLFYPGVREKMYELMKGPFTAVFMNTCDVMILPEHSKQIKKALKTASEKNEYGEFLSASAYRCDKEGIQLITK